MPKGIPSTRTSRQQLRHWEAVCRYLDAQPYRAVAYPYPSDPPMSTRLFKRMARTGLMRHRDDCRWQLALRWQAILRRLMNGEMSDLHDHILLDGEDGAAQPFVVDCGVDTLYANLRSANGLPATLVAACDALKAKAQEDDATVETPWSILGAPLSIYKSGKGTNGSGRGVSWSYILRNGMVMLVLRKTPLNGLLGSVRISAEALWTRGARAALDAVRDDLRLLWSWAELGSFKSITWQLSQLHLCVDVAHFAPEPTDLNRLLTRSVKKSVHLPSTEDIHWALSADGVETLLSADALWLLAQEEPPGWDSLSIPADIGSDALEVSDPSNDADGDEFEEFEFAEEQGAVTHLWGQRASGLAFSQGADLSAVWYDKALQERLSGKVWMEPIHRAGGWEPSMPLWRIEARFHRGILRELSRAHSPADQPREAGWFDDPWVALEHLNDLWAYFAGVPPEADTAPDVTYRGWMRLTVPEGNDSNRSRWPTDPVWTLVQGARFTSTSPIPLARQPRITHDLDRVDAEVYGLLKLRAALRGEYLDTTATLGQELHAFANRMDEVDADKQRDFAEEVREKARMLGKPLPPRFDTAALAIVDAAGGATC
jgi:hypothetical protein